MVVVTKQSKDKTLAVYSIPEDVLKNYLLDSDATTFRTIANDSSIELNGRSLP